MHNTGRFQYGKLAKYPHMEKEDILTWEKFIDAYPTAYQTCDYDFALSKVEEATAHAAELGIPGAERVYKYRCDVLGYTENEVHLIEVKGRASPAVIGQVLADYELYKRDFSPAVEARPVVIARSATPDMDHICRVNGIELILV